MSEKDIFEDLEKAIDDAFKPEEKKKIKEVWKKFPEYMAGVSNGGHSHYVSSNSHYVSNEAYDQLMFGHLNYYRHGNLSENEYHCIKCGVRHLIIIESPSPQTLSYRHIEGRIPHEAAMETSTHHCPSCGEITRFYGKIIKAVTEVRQYDS